MVPDGPEVFVKEGEDADLFRRRSRADIPPVAEEAEAEPVEGEEPVVEDVEEGEDDADE